MNKKDQSILSARDKLEKGFAQTYEAQRIARQNKNDWMQSIIDSPLQGIHAFISVKDGKKAAGIMEQEKEFYKKAALNDMYGCISASKNKAFSIIKATEKERYIHDRAAVNYEEAKRLYKDAENAEKLLSEWQQAISVTDWRGNPWKQQQKTNEGATK